MSANGKEAVRLCEHIVRHTFGDVICRVASTLLNRGRLPSPTVARLSGVPKPQTLAALLILMQHNLVQSNGASMKETGEDEQYEFVTTECLYRLRWGRILAITHDKLKDLVAYEVVKQLMVFGKLRVPEIIEACGGKYSALRASEVNDAIITLLRQRFLHCTAPELQILRSDQVARREAANRRRLIHSTGSSLLSANEQQNCLLEAEHDVDTANAALRDISRVLIVKQKIDKDRRRRAKGARAVPGDEYDYELQQDVHLRVNYDRYSVLIRDELIVKAATDRWNAGAGVVMRAVLDASLGETSSLKDDRTFDPVGLNTILDLIPDEAAPTLLKGLSVSSRTSISEMVRIYLSMLAGEDQVVGSGLVFLQRDGTTNPSYKVELEAICVRLRETLLTELVREQLGDKAARVLSVVTKASKAFETTVRDCAMVPLKDSRHLLAELAKLSLVETQEVPKTAAKSRAGLPSSAEYHLWAVDLPRVYGTLLTNVYKVLGNILQRRLLEVQRKDIPLQKEEKAGAAGRGILPMKDQDDLRDLDDTLKKLALAEARSEMVSFILRDLPGWPGQR
ncbi:hypothetical protein IAT38_003829 [Cryptococcus sp. DSM 104549]